MYNINTKITTITNHAPSKLKNIILDVIINYTRQLSTIDADLENLDSIIQTIHNQADSLTTSEYLKFLSNINLISFSKIAAVKKIASFYLNFKQLGGFNVLKGYQKNIDELLELKTLDPNYIENFKKVVDFFESNNKISLGDQEVVELLKVCNSAETDLQFIKDALLYKKYYKIAEDKNKNIFKLDYEISPNLRFRSLKEKDPRHLRIGIETDCCQRVGGAGEFCVVDSFINQYAGILILEQYIDMEWQLLSQSWFHYVPKENGFILDNIESSDLGKSIKNEYLANYYFELAKYVQSKGFNYLLAGKGYSDIKIDLFNTNSKDEDPRTFNKNSF